MSFNPESSEYVALEKQVPTILEKLVLPDKEAEFMDVYAAVRHRGLDVTQEMLTFALHRLKKDLPDGTTQIGAVEVAMRDGGLKGSFEVYLDPNAQRRG